MAFVLAGCGVAVAPPTPAPATPAPDSRPLPASEPALQGEDAASRLAHDAPAEATNGDDIPRREPKGIRGTFRPAPAADSANAGFSTPVELTDLLKYLGADYATFQPYESRYFAALRDLLAGQGIVGAQDFMDRTTYRDAVRLFQRSRGLPVSGVPDKDTLWALQVDWAKARRLDVIKVAADVWPGRRGFDSFMLRRDVADSYNRFREAVTALGGVVTSDGSLRDLSAKVTAGRSPTSLHYLGIAFDLAIATGMQDKDGDPYIITKEGKGWHVWARADGGTERTLDAVLWGNGQVRVEPVTASVIDFTGLARQFGFRDIEPHSCFPVSYTCGEWWHFQSEKAVVPFISQFGTELLGMNKYTESTLQGAQDIWLNRKFILEP